MATDRRADVTWKGSLIDGSGTIESTTSGAIGEHGVSWAARSEDDDGREHEPRGADRGRARCVLLDGALRRTREGGNPPDELKTSATVTFQPGEGITKIALTVEGRVPGLDAAAFEEAAQGAKANCPVSKALAGVPEITLDARLAG